jgi:hypothetical protein
MWLPLGKRDPPIARMLDSSEGFMLRVEASNLKTTGDLPRPRRLLPRPPAVPEFSPSPAQELLLPPPDDMPARVDTSAPERWVVRLELGDEDIAKLYGQGMTRGAVVWRKGMVEWRPLLITPELTGLLRRTRTTLTSLPDELAERPVGPTTVAPMAMDVAAPGTAASGKPRRSVEFAAVAVAAFALAWIGHGILRADAPSAALADGREALAPPAAACEPATVTTAGLLPNAPPLATATSSTIPIIAVTDLPLAGRAAVPTAMHSESRRAPSRPSSAGQPSRSELSAALSRVAQSARGCGERGGPVRVTMSFAASGVARSIQVSGRDLPAPTSPRLRARACPRFRAIR